MYIKEEISGHHIQIAASFNQSNNFVEKTTKIQRLIPKIKCHLNPSKTVTFVSHVSQRDTLHYNYPHGTQTSQCINIQLNLV